MALSEFMKSRQAHINAGRPLPEKPKPKWLKPISDKRKAKMEAEKKEPNKSNEYKQKELLEYWFAEKIAKHFTVFGGQCMECGDHIPIDYARHAIAHLLPKKLFKSVATNDLNYMVLGSGCGCHDKTHRVDKVVTLRVWPEIKKRINAMLPLLPFDELKHLSSQLMKALQG